MSRAPGNRQEALIEAATTAWRPSSTASGIRPHPAWADLDAEGRELAYERTRQLRRLEAALDVQGLSSTSRAVLSRVRRRISWPDA